MADDTAMHGIKNTHVISFLSIILPCYVKSKSLSPCCVIKNLEHLGDFKKVCLKAANLDSEHSSAVEACLGVSTKGLLYDR
jgi:hypothetical protein